MSRNAIAESTLFFREYLRHFQTTGAVLPSGRFLAAALTRFIGNGAGNAAAPGDVPAGAREFDSEQQRGRMMLEVGPGTGAVTRRIVAGMRPDDRLDLVELNDTFVERLERRFKTSRYSAPSPTV